MTKRLCDSCEAEGAELSRFGNSWLCPECKKACEDEERARIEEHKAQVDLLASVPYHAKEPGIAYALTLAKITQSGQNAISIEKLPDFINSNVTPLVALMSLEDCERMFLTVKEFYFALQKELTMRPTQAGREADVIKRQTKREKTRERAITEITKQKKNASRDKSLSKEERGRAMVIEGLVRSGMSETQAIAIFDASKKGKK